MCISALLLLAVLLPVWPETSILLIRRELVFSRNTWHCFISCLNFCVFKEVAFVLILKIFLLREQCPCFILCVVKCRVADMSEVGSLLSLCLLCTRGLSVPSHHPTFLSTSGLWKFNSEVSLCDSLHVYSGFSTFYSVTI